MNGQLRLNRIPEFNLNDFFYSIDSACAFNRAADCFVACVVVLSPSTQVLKYSSPRGKRSRTAKKIGIEKLSLQRPSQPLPEIIPQSGATRHHTCTLLSFSFPVEAGTSHNTTQYRLI